MIARGLLFPLSGALLVISLATLAIRVWALIDAVSHPEAAYVAAGKLSKTAWMVILIVGLFLSFLGLIAAIVYLVDVRPAVRGSRGDRGSRGGSSSDGPYGPYRG